MLSKCKINLSSSLCRQMLVSLMQSLVSGPRGPATTLQRHDLAKGWSASPGGHVCEPDSRRRTEERKEPKWGRSVDLNERKDDQKCEGFLWCISGHSEHLISRHFLPKTRYFLNNDRGHYTNVPLNKIVPLSSDEGQNLHAP